MSSSPNPPDYKSWSSEQLIQRVLDLETQLRTQISAIPSTLQHTTSEITPETAAQKKKSAKAKKVFDPSKYSTRYIALKFAYLGSPYNGFEHHANNTTPLPTIEEEIWKALVKCRLIFPPSLEKHGLLSGDVRERLADLARAIEDGGIGCVPVDWEGVEYSKCGRTDRGVSAFGQVIALRVRSARKSDEGHMSETVEQDDSLVTVEEDVEKVEEKEFDSIKDELPYLSMLNHVLPPSIRMLAWCPKPPENFNARFSCKEREYRYFFTSPASLPVPDAKDSALQVLNIDAMREAAGYLLGTNDFRNMCKLDGSKQLTEFKRRIDEVSIERMSDLPEPRLLTTASSTPDQLGVYAFKIRGSAFLWHQVRCMVGLLFLVGQGLEQPTIIKELLDVEKCPAKPVYEMASDTPLVLWNCKFSVLHGKVTEKDTLERPLWDRGSGDDELEWIYTGEVEKNLSDGKWAQRGIMESLWKTWRSAKMDEILASQLLDLVGESRCNDDPTRLERLEGHKGGVRIFAGDNTASQKIVYVPIMRRKRLDTVEVLNARWAAGSGRVVAGLRPPMDK